MSKYFSPLRVGGKLVDLLHLDPLTILFHSDKVGKALRVAVTFTNHCFSEEVYGPTPHLQDDEVIWDGSRKRVFCPTRYRLSKDLPRLVRELPEKRVILAAHKRSWVHTLTVEDPAGPYHLFLTIKRSAPEKRTWQDIDVVVESAFPETRNPPSTTGFLRPFLVVCSEIYIGRPSRPKPKRRR